MVGDRLRGVLRPLHLVGVIGPPHGRTRVGRRRRRALWRRRLRPCRGRLDRCRCRCRCRRRSGDGPRGRLVAVGRGRRRPRAAAREDAQRIEVPVLVARHADAEVDVRPGHLRVAARADTPDGGALRDGRALPHQQLAEVGEGDHVAVRRQHGKRPTVAWHGPRERDGALRGRADRLARLARHVDAAMLPSGVGIGAESERTEDVPADRPRPRERPTRRDQRERAHDSREGRPEDPSRSVAHDDNTLTRIARRSGVVNGAYTVAR
jgi:hypothetical protein